MDGNPLNLLLLDTATELSTRRPDRTGDVVFRTQSRKRTVALDRLANPNPPTVPFRVENTMLDSVKLVSYQMT